MKILTFFPLETLASDSNKVEIWSLQNRLTMPTTLHLLQIYL